MAKVTISLRSETWQAFRIACLRHKLVASKEIERMLWQQMQAWQREEDMLKPSQSPH